MVCFAKDYLVEDERLFDEEVDIFNLTFSETETAFAIERIPDIYQNSACCGNCKLINGILIFTLREFPGLVVDILSTNNYVARLTRQIIHSISSPQRRPANA
jgi:hypothetical protein